MISIALNTTTAWLKRIQMFISVVTSLMLLVAAQFAQAGQSGNYVGIYAGLAEQKNSSLTDRNGDSAKLSYNNGVTVSAGFGHQFESGLRIEEELFYKNCATNKLTYSASATNVGPTAWSIGAMSNLYYDWYHSFEVMADRPISPYMGIGIGVANINLPEGAINSVKVWNSGSDIAFAYQISIGSGFKVSRDIMFDVLYRYFDTTEIKIDQIKAGFSNHNILLGLRYTFR